MGRGMIPVLSGELISAIRQFPTEHSRQHDQLCSGLLNIMNQGLLGVYVLNCHILGSCTMVATVPGFFTGVNGLVRY